MAILAREKQLVVSVEDTKGTAETITNADVAILAEAVTYSTGNEEIVRDPLRQTLSKYQSIPGPTIATVTCRVEMKGSGTANTEPEWGTLLKGCGFKATLGTDQVAYELTSTDADSETLTIAVFEGPPTAASANKYLCKGARGNVSFEADANGIMYMNFTFTGIHETYETTAALSSLTYDSTTPQPFRNTSTTFNFGSAWSDSVFSTFSLDMNNEVTLRQNANATDGLSYAIITNRDPSGSIDFDQVLQSSEDLLSHITTPTTGSLAFDLGATTGNKISWAAPAIQILDIEPGDREGVATHTATFKLRTGGSDDDELTLTQT
jgi:hypothetical protein